VRVSPSSAEGPTQPGTTIPLSDIIVTAGCGWIFGARACRSRIHPVLSGSRTGDEAWHGERPLTAVVTISAIQEKLEAEVVIWMDIVSMNSTAGELASGGLELGESAWGVMDAIRLAFRDGSLTPTSQTPRKSSRGEEVNCFAVLQSPSCSVGVRLTLVKSFKI